MPAESPAGKRFLLTAASFVIVVAGLRAASAIVIPILLAALIAVLCAPAVLFLQRKRVPVLIAVALVVLAILVAGVAMGTLLGTSVKEFTKELPTYQLRIEEETKVFVDWLREKGVAVPEEALKDTFNPGVAMGLAANILSGLGGLLTNAFLIVLTVVFILLEASTLPAKISAASENMQVPLSGFRRFAQSVNRYLAIKTLLSLATGIAVAVWLALLGVDFPLLWGLLAFLLNYVPNIGSFIAAIPAALLALIQQGPHGFLLTVAGYTVINVVFGNLVEPRLMGRRLGLSPLVVFLSLVFWGWVFGAVGMLLSVPLTMILKIALESRDETRWAAILLDSERPAPNHRIKPPDS
jgi:predicted PurR-regulated permease PerM